jgi:hypothetical protein
MNNISHIDVFSDIYKNNKWGNNGQSEYQGSSGPGSFLKNVINTYVPFLKKFINDNSIKSVVDLGCGDFVAGPVIYNDLNVSYSGYDAYEAVVKNNTEKNEDNMNIKYTFTHLDFYANKEQIRSADLCILKDVIQHWKLNEIYNFMDYIVSSKKFKYILLVNSSLQTKDNTDIETGEFRHLSINFLPLKKYNPTLLYKYVVPVYNDTKEVCLITL